MQQCKKSCSCSSFCTIASITIPKKNLPCMTTHPLVWVCGHCLPFQVVAWPHFAWPRHFTWLLAWLCRFPWLRFASRGCVSRRMVAFHVAWLRFMSRGGVSHSCISCDWVSRDWVWCVAVWALAGWVSLFSTWDQAMA